MSYPLDGGQGARPCPAHLHLEGRRAPYLVRLIEPNPIASHDWHVQPICQRSLGVVRLSGTPWIEAQTRVWIVLELGALAPDSRVHTAAPAFWRELFKGIKIAGSGQAESSNGPAKAPFARAAQKIKERPAKIARADRARGRRTPGSCNGLFSVGFPTGVSTMRKTAQLVRPYEPASHFPLAGQATRPPGGSTAPFNLIRVTQDSRRCKFDNRAANPALQRG